MIHGRAGKTCCLKSGSWAVIRKSSIVLLYGRVDGWKPHEWLDRVLKCTYTRHLWQANNNLDVSF